MSLEVILKTGRDASLRRRHPWVYSGAVARVNGQALPGAVAAVRASDGEFLAWAAMSPASQIRLRAWSFSESDGVDAAFVARRVAAAIENRRRLGLLNGDGACRLVHAEADGLPGLIVDRYAGFIVCQFLAAAIEPWRHAITETLHSALGPDGIYERSAASVRRKEGLPSRQGVLTGQAPPDTVEFAAGDLRLLVNIAHGQKTGGYLDQTVNRARVATHAAGARVLDAFAHTGGFALAALAAGAREAWLVESAADTLELARQQARLNGHDDGCNFIAGNAFECLRELQSAGEQFDIVVLDPPKLVHGPAQVNKGARAYKDVNRIGMGLVRPGGLLATFSCSGNIDRPLFQKILASAALEAGRQAAIIEPLSQGPDHPVPLSFPEAEYLKGFLLQVP
jgi:23S rRNA (cytosine1962-C5)-methyltransferase